MPIKWSALEVAEAMDEVEELVSKAEPFLADAEARVGKATGIRICQNIWDNAFTASYSPFNTGKTLRLP